MPDLKKAAADNKGDSSTIGTKDPAAEAAFLPAPKLRGRTKELGLLPLVPQTTRISSVHMSRSRWWSRLACFPSHDGQALAIFKGPQIDATDTSQLKINPDLVEIRRGGRSVLLQIEFTSIRELRWSPDNRWLAYWAQHQGKLRLLAVDTADLASTPVPIVLYDPPAGQVPFAHEWVPAGDALSVIVRFYEGSEGFSMILLVPFAKGKAGEPRQVLRMRGHLDWESIPASRFEDGDGPSKEPWQRLYGAYDGLWISDPEGTDRRRVAGMAAVGLQNIEWTPEARKTQAVLYFARTAYGEAGESYKGLHLIDLSSGELKRVQLHPTSDVHTLWYSPKGTYVTWATPEGVFIVPSARPTEMLTIPACNGRPSTASHAPSKVWTLFAIATWG